MGWTVEERRRRIVDAALQVASDRGLENVNLRAAAHAAGVSWDSAQDLFADHADLLRALSLTVTERNISAERLDLGGGNDPEAFARVGARLWAALSTHRDLQLVSYELTMLALRRTALRPVVVAQYDNQRALALRIIDRFAEQNGVTWTRPREEIARFASTLLDGVSMAWLIDGDDAAAERQTVLLAEVLGGFVSQEEP